MKVIAPSCFVRWQEEIDRCILLTAKRPEFLEGTPADAVEIDRQQLQQWIKDCQSFAAIGEVYQQPAPGSVVLEGALFCGIPIRMKKAVPHA